MAITMKFGTEIGDLDYHIGYFLSRYHVSKTAG